MSSRLARGGALLVAIAAAGCTTSSPLDSPTSTIVVHAVLNPGQDDQIVAVQRTTHGVPDAAPIDSAMVTITGPDGAALTGVEVSDTALVRVYRVRLSSYGAHLVPGGTYRLHVHLKTGEDVTGSTTIPNATPVTPSGASVPFYPAIDTLRLNWPAVPGARRYEVRVQARVATYAQFVDTSVVLPGNLLTFSGDRVFTGETNNTVIVSAVDANYYEYYRTSSDPFTGATVQGSLSGAEGVFGSVVVVRAVILYVATAH